MIRNYLVNMLDPKTINNIKDFVYLRPRTIQEIAQHIKRNWRTADKYVNQIAEDTGVLSVRTFRKGTRGALKIVYWSNIVYWSDRELSEDVTFQDRLYRKIESGRKKEDFDPFDIYQHVDKNKRDSFMESFDDPLISKQQDITNFLRQAERQVLVFSGNISWINIVENKLRVLDIVEELIKRKVRFRVLSRVDLASVTNLEKIKRLNSNFGEDFFEVRHCVQPLRCFIIDNKVARLKHVMSKETYKKGELKKDTRIFYNIYDDEWIAWLQKVFWNMFRTAVPADKRLDNFEEIQDMII